MKTLHLTLKKKWFDMIASGEKKEEYRECKPYWYSRLVHSEATILMGETCWNVFNTVTFRNGYAKDAPTITLKLKGIEIGPAAPEWSDNWQGEVFIIKLGDILSLTK